MGSVSCRIADRIPTTRSHRRRPVSETRARGQEHVSHVHMTKADYAHREPRSRLLDERISRGGDKG
jgi:hypothetical protein